MKKTAIEWTDYSWNPWQGCKKVSPACDHCYMYRDKKRFGQKGSDIHRSAEATFRKPLNLPAGSKVFTCSWSDFFLEEADAWRDDAWEIIRRTPHLIYQILTKRPENIRDRLPEDWEENFGHVWLGVTAENQEMADTRIPKLLEIPASVHFVSVEPMLGPIDLRNVMTPFGGYDALLGFWNIDAEDRGLVRDGVRYAIDWVIVGGESGHRARKMTPIWVEKVYRDCKRTKTPFFFKQWGRILPDRIKYLKLGFEFDELKDFPKEVP